MADFRKCGIRQHLFQKGWNNCCWFLSPKVTMIPGKVDWSLLQCGLFILLKCFKLWISSGVGFGTRYASLTTSSFLWFVCFWAKMTELRLFGVLLKENQHNIFELSDLGGNYQYSRHIMLDDFVKAPFFVLLPVFEHSFTPWNVIYRHVVWKIVLAYPTFSKIRLISVCLICAFQNLFHVKKGNYLEFVSRC